MTSTVTCLRCRCSPCVCAYLAELEPGGQFAWRRAEAVRMAKHPQPIVGGHRTYHYSTCPCPKCYALRQASFTGYPDGLTAYPLPPSKESWAPQPRSGPDDCPDGDL